MVYDPITKEGLLELFKKELKVYKEVSRKRRGDLQESINDQENKLREIRKNPIKNWRRYFSFEVSMIKSNISILKESLGYENQHFKRNVKKREQLIAVIENTTYYVPNNEQIFKAVTFILENE